VLITQSAICQTEKLVVLDQILDATYAELSIIKEL
jgi:uncharacterized protein